MVNLQEFAIELRNYFKSCPICHGSAKGTFSVHLTAGQKDTLTCKICGASWNLHIVPFRGFEWAELELTAKDGRGAEYLGRKLDKNEILSIAKKDSSEQNNPSTVTKEITREKETATKAPGLNYRYMNWKIASLIICCSLIVTVIGVILNNVFLIIGDCIFLILLTLLMYYKSEKPNYEEEYRAENTKLPRSLVKILAKL
jgi:hypothetical protein